MGIGGNKKSVTQGASVPYGEIILNNGQEENQEVEYERYVLNLDKALIEALEDHIFELKKQGEKLLDVKSGNYKKVNRSLWARDLFAKELQKLGKFNNN